MKKLLPYLAFSLLLVVTFLSCEEEPHLELDSPETITEVPRSSFNSRSYVNMDDIPEVIGSLEKRMGSKVSKSGLGLGNKISAKDYEVFLDSIAQVANEGSNTNYTFALDVKGAGPYEFYNLVVGKTPDGEIKDPIVVRYALEQEDMDYFMNGGTDLKRLNAKYSYYNFERFFDENLKMTASGTGDCGSGYIGGGSGGGPTVPPGGSIQTSGFGVTVTTNFQTGHVTTVPYDFNISVTDENGNTEVNSGQAYSQNLDGVFATNYGQQDIDPIVLPPETATFNQDNRATQDQNGTINLGCSGSSYLDGAGWHINGCEESGTGQHNKGSVTAKAGDCEIPEGTMATLTTFTLMILNKTSGYIGLNLAVPVDWSRYLWLSHRVIPVCIPINQFVEGEGQSNEAKEISDDIALDMMEGIEITDIFEEFGNRQFLKDIVESPSFQTTKTILEAATAASSNSKEKLYAGTITNNAPINYTFLGESGINQGEIILQNPINSPVTSLFHNHYLKANTGNPTDGRLLKTFSPADVLNFFVLANANLIQDLDTFNLILMTPDNDLHAIMIADQSIFASHLATMQQGNFQDNLEVFELLLNFKYGNQNDPINSNIDSGLAAKRLHAILKDYGLVIFEFDESKNKWVRP